MQKEELKTGAFVAVAKNGKFILTPRAETGAGSEIIIDRADIDELINFLMTHKLEK